MGGGEKTKEKAQETHIDADTYIFAHTEIPQKIQIWKQLYICKSKKFYHKAAKSPDHSGQGISSNNFKRFGFARIEIYIVRQDILRFNDALRPIALVDKLFEHLCRSQPIIPCNQQLMDTGR